MMQFYNLNDTRQIIQEEVNREMSDLASPLDVGDVIYSLSEKLPNTPIISRKRFLWIRLDLFAGTIGSQQSLADLRDDLLELFYFHLGGTASEWEQGQALPIADYRGRALRIAGKGKDLDHHLLGSLAGKERHRLTIAEIPYHKHGGGNHAHLQRSKVTPNKHAVDNGDLPKIMFHEDMGGVNVGTHESGPIILGEGGNMFHPTLGPSAYLAAIAFLGVRE
ncbi:MAG: hypothetical protein J7647_01705 [Cyanobacteria bacterium SBLK]|nr:hypothetical protein [Cyanobacteria bacterium SBLK]